MNLFNCEYQKRKVFEKEGENMPYKLSAGKLSSDLFFHPYDKNRRVKSHNTNAAFVIVKRKRKSNISLIVTDSVELF